MLYYNEVVQRSRGQRRRRRLAARAEKRSAEAKADRKKRIAEMRAARAAHAAAADGAGGGAGGGAGAGAEEEGSDEDSDGYHDLSSVYEVLRAATATRVAASMRCSHTSVTYPPLMSRMASRTASLVTKPTRPRWTTRRSPRWRANAT